MQTLQISEEKAKQMYPGSSKEWKEILEASFGKDFFSPKKITDWVKTFEDACKITGEDPNDIKFTTGEPDEIAYKKLKVIRNALLDGKTINVHDLDKEKWYPWHKWTSSGFRFDDSIFGLAGAYVPARLCLDSEEKATYFGKQFIELFEQFKS